MRSSVVVFMASLMVGLAFPGCEGGKMNGKISLEVSTSDLSDAALMDLSGKRIYFGHQSVGFNIVEGLKDLMKSDPRIRLNIIESDNLSMSTGPVFMHSPVGKNGDPELKIREFGSIIEKGGIKADFAFLKFCYVDIDGKTDVRALFEKYRSAAKALSARYPKTTFLHVTAPLRTQPVSYKTRIKQVIGLGTPWEVAENIRRNEFNELLVNEYGKKAPVFDIAVLESTYPDGRRASFGANGKTYSMLAPEYTHDGGHLNEIGRRIAARELLRTLSSLSAIPSGK